MCAFHWRKIYILALHSFLLSFSEWKNKNLYISGSILNGLIHMQLPWCKWCYPKPEFISLKKNKYFSRRQKYRWESIHERSESSIYFYLPLINGTILFINSGVFELQIFQNEFDLKYRFHRLQLIEINNRFERNDTMTVKKTRKREEDKGEANFFENHALQS